MRYKFDFNSLIGRLRHELVGKCYRENLHPSFVNIYINWLLNI